MWDPRRDCFVIYAKTWIDAPDGRRFWKRAIIRTESKDFVDWSMPQLIIVPDDGDLGQIHGASVFIFTVFILPRCNASILVVSTGAAPVTCQPSWP
ncbi:MAG: hypothetical protein CM1200mP29_11960 [Verrucomicrobiota bacterium]|nr:MAG: hypothetical protein CM1200mP29_11960 [Verrucomicrobiota bacterium]